MRAWWRPVALLALVALLATACGGSDATTDIAAALDDSSASENASSTTPVLPTVAGGQIDFADLEGQDTILWFWAPW